MRLVGAENERELLESCLKKRRTLLGEPERDEKDVPKKEADVEVEPVCKQQGILPECGDHLTDSELAYRDQSDVYDHGCDKIATVVDELSQEVKEETTMQKKARLMREKAQKLKEDRLEHVLAKAADREARAAKRKEELLAATKEKARKQRERVARKQELTRLARDQGCRDLETTLKSIEDELAEAIANSGTESEYSVALAAKAEHFRQRLTDHRAGVEKKGLSPQELEIFSRRSLLLADDGSAQTTDGWQASMAPVVAAAPALTNEERELIAEHRRGQALVSDSALGLVGRARWDPPAPPRGIDRKCVRLPS